MGCNFTFDKGGLNRSFLCQLKMAKRPHMECCGLGTPVAFQLLVGLESAARHSMTLQCLKNSKREGLEINNKDEVIPASITLNIKNVIKGIIIFP